MLNIYRDAEGTVRSGGLNEDLPGHVIWLDLINPNSEEIEFVERRAKVKVPTKEALSEIEVTSRLSKSGDRLYLSAPVIGQATTEHAELSPAGFIVSSEILITVRYETLPSFDAVAERLQREEALASGMGVFVALLEAIVDRGADVLEHLASAVDEVSRTVFRGNLKGSTAQRGADFTLRKALSKVGALGDRSSKARDVLLGVGRMATFTLDVCHEMLSDEFRDQLHRRLKRRCIIERLRDAPVRQDAVPAGCGPGLHHDRTERHFQSPNDCLGGRGTTHTHGRRVGNEFQIHAGTELDMGLPLRVECNYSQCRGSNALVLEEGLVLSFGCQTEPLACEIKTRPR